LPAHLAVRRPDSEGIPVLEAAGWRSRGGQHDISWAAVKGHLDAVAEAAARPVIEKYTGVLRAVDVFTTATAFTILESIRLDLGYRMDVQP
jgi:hypothetical protein